MISAVIFDLDGTVLDNEGAWQAAFSAVAVSHGLPEFIHTPGIGVLNNWKKVVHDHTVAEIYTKETKQLYMEQNADGEVQVREGTVELVEKIQERGMQTALATGTEWTVVEKELEQLNLYLAFDVTTTGDEVLAQKPDPEIFILTCQKLGVEPNECMVIEDSVAGVEAAHEIGCQVVGIASNFESKTRLEAAGCDFVVDNLNEVVLILPNGNENTPQSNPENPEESVSN